MKMQWKRLVLGCPASQVFVFDQWQHNIRAAIDVYSQSWLNIDRSRI